MFSEFRELTEELDPRYKLSHQYKIVSEIEKVYQYAKAEISESLSGATKIIIYLCRYLVKPRMTAFLSWV